MQNNKGSLVAERTLKTLMLFAKHKNLLVTDVANSLEISVTAAYRLIETMHSLGFIKRTNNKSYTLDPLNILQLYNMVDQDIRRIARPILRELVEQLDESVYLSVLYKDKNYIYIDKEDSPSPFKWATNLGEVLPLPAGTAGKTHLAYLVKDLDGDGKNAFISQLELKSYTKNSITDIDKLKESLNEIIKNGFCLTHGEHSQGVVGIAVPIFNFDKTNVVAVLGVHMLEASYSENKLQEYVDTLKRGAKKISENIY